MSLSRQFRSVFHGIEIAAYADLGAMIIRERLQGEGIDVFSDEVKVVATGYGRVAVDFAD